MSKLIVTVQNQPLSKKIVRLVLNSPQTLNAIDIDLYKELKEVLDNLAQQDDIGVLIIGSEVTKAFSAGIDVKYVQRLTNEEAAHFFQGLSDLLNTLVHFPLPTIAVVNGYAFGAGGDLAISCDLRIATSSARFRFPGPKFGLLLGTDRLIHEIGPSRARLLTLLGGKVDAKTAKWISLVHEVCEDIDAANETALDWSVKLLQLPDSTAYALKELCNQGVGAGANCTQNSVLRGDFQARFQRYLKK